MKIYAIKQMNGTFKPAFDSDYEKAKKIKAGDEVELNIKRPRNIRFHRKAFALLNMAYQNQEVYNNFEHFREDMTIEAGYYDKWTNFNNKIRLEAKSISFASMDEDEFEKYYSAMIDTIISVFDYDKEMIEQNLIDFM